MAQRLKKRRKRHRQRGEWKVTRQKINRDENAPSVALFLSNHRATLQAQDALARAAKKYLSFLSSLEFKSKEMMDLVPAAGDEETNEDDDDDNESRMLSKNRAALLWLRDALLDLP